jgi:2-oxoisovalerate dehydrogenase E2 component (dihydrolipoyl transacylase)
MGKNASPAARKLAKEHGIDLNEVRGTGKNDTITKLDVIIFGNLSEDDPAPGSPDPAPVSPDPDIPAKTPEKSRKPVQKVKADKFAKKGMPAYKSYVRRNHKPKS